MQYFNNIINLSEDELFKMEIHKLYSLTTYRNSLRDKATRVYKIRLKEIRDHINYTDEDNGNGILFNFNKKGCHKIYEKDYGKRCFM